MNLDLQEFALGIQFNFTEETAQRELINIDRWKVSEWRNNYRETATQERSTRIGRLVDSYDTCEITPLLKMRWQRALRRKLVVSLRYNLLLQNFACEADFCEPSHSFKFGKTQEWSPSEQRAHHEEKSPEQKIMLFTLHPAFASCFCPCFFGLHEYFQRPNEKKRTKILQVVSCGIDFEGEQVTEAKQMEE